MKDRPCAVLLTVVDTSGETLVVVLPITHRPPADPTLAVAIPAATKRRLGLDDEQSWIVIGEANRFIWPGPDLRFAVRGDASSVVFGHLPRALFETVRSKWLALHAARRARVVQRTE